MATPRDLIKITSKVTRIPEVTVSTYYKKLREAGLVTKSGRGRSAAKMLPRDAATLVVGLAMSATAKDAPAEVKKIFNTPRISPFGTPFSGNTFGEWVEEIFLAVSDETISEILNQIPDEFITAKLDKRTLVDANDTDTSFFLVFDRDIKTVDFCVERFGGSEARIETFVPDEDPCGADDLLRFSTQILVFGQAIFEICEVVSGEGRT